MFKPLSNDEFGQISFELSSRRTGMSFQRMRLSAERTLMSVIRSSLALISIGFTIFLIKDHFQQASIPNGLSWAPSLGVALVLWGIGLQALGIWHHIHFMLELRGDRERLKVQHLIHGESGYPVSMTLIVAVLLLVMGLLVIVGMVFNAGPFA